MITAHVNWVSSAAAVAVILTAMGTFIILMFKFFRSLDRLTIHVEDLQKQIVDLKGDLAELASEFPKNGVPTRATIDAIKDAVSEVRVEVVELKASHRAHLVMLHDKGREL